MQDRTEYWVLKTSKGKVTELIQDHVRVFMSGRVESMEDFAGIMSSLSAPYLHQISNMRLVACVSVVVVTVVACVCLVSAMCVLIM